MDAWALPVPSFQVGGRRRRHKNVQGLRVDRGEHRAAVPTNGR